MSAPAQQRLAAEPAPRMIVEAQRYAARGWRVLPLRYAVDGRCSCGNPKGIADHDYKQGGKHPIPKEWQNLATTDWAQVAKWWRDHPKANIGIATGEASGIFVLDVDPANGGLESLAALEKEHGQLPRTRRTESGSGGPHIYFTWPGFNPGNSAGKLGPGLDIRADGGQVVAPPSVSVKGPYTVRDDTDPVPAPEWLVDMLRPPPPRPPVQPGAFRVDPGHLDKYTRNAVQGECDSIVTALHGTQNNAINRAAFNIGQLVGAGALSEGEARQALLSACRAGNHPEGRSEDAINSGLPKGMAQPRNPWPPVSRPHDTEADFRALIAPDDGQGIDWSDANSEPPAEPEPAVPAAAEQTAKKRGLLPQEFFDARPELQRIQQAAYAINRSPDVAFAGVAARIAALLPPDRPADTGVGSPASMNLFVALLGPSGTGKSSSKRVPKFLVPAPPGLDVLEYLPMGTGEGVAEAYMGEVEVADSSGGRAKTKTVREQVRSNALFYADEGERLITTMFGRSGTTIGETLRTAWSGGTIGQFNGQKINTRVVEEGAYSAGLIIGFQPETALPLFDDAAAGTPQRFLWFSTLVESLPEDPPPWPRPLELPLLASQLRHQEITFAESIRKELRAEDRARMTGELVPPLLDSHKPLTLVKLAVVLAVLDNRADVTTEDWDLARVVWDTSCQVRDGLVEQAARQRAQEEEQRTKQHVERTVRAHKAVSSADRNVERVARRLASKVHEAGGLTVGALRTAIAHRDRGFLSDALDFAEAQGWTDYEGDKITPGGSKPS